MLCEEQGIISFRWWPVCHGTLLPHQSLTLELRPTTCRVVSTTYLVLLCAEQAQLQRWQRFFTGRLMPYHIETRSTAHTVEYLCSSQC